MASAQNSPYAKVEYLGWLTWCPSTATWKPRREASGEIDLADILILDFQPPGLWENKFLLFKPPRLWYFFFFFLWLCWVLVSVRGLSLVAASGDHSSWRCRGLSCCGAQAPDAQAQQLWLTGPAAPRHVGSSQTRARTRVPCTGRQTLNHCATREASKAVVFCYSIPCKLIHYHLFPFFSFYFITVNVFGKE